MRSLLLRALPLALFAVCLTVPVAGAAGTTVTIPVGSAPGTPARYNKVFVTKFGPASAKTVLVLVPGTIGGAGDFSLLGPELAARVPGLQVWALDRREQALEDSSRMQQALDGTISVQQAFDYYLGWIADQKITTHFQPLAAKNFTFMKNWGMKVNMEDIRRVVLKAGQGGRKVVLGGHSLGASFAAGYAAWDFNGKPGYKDIAGIVAIDGGLLGSFDSITSAAQAKTALAKLDVTAKNPDGPWANLLQLPGFPWTTGAFAELGALAALTAPGERSAFQDFALLPAQFKPPVPATNEGLLGYAFDASTSPKALSLIQVRAGNLAATGDPRPWQNGEVTPIQNLAKGFGGGKVDGVDWYYPSRLNVDTNAASPMRATPAAKALGLRLKWLSKVDIPYYAFQTSLTGRRNGVVNGAKAFARKSKVPKGGLVIVDGKATTSHLDPLFAAPATNQFLKTVVPFLRRVR